MKFKEQRKEANIDTRPALGSSYRIAAMPPLCVWVAGLEEQVLGHRPSMGVPFHL